MESNGDAFDVERWALSALSKDALKNRSFERCTIICLTDHDCITIGGPILEVCLSLLPEDHANGF